MAAVSGEKIVSMKVSTQGMVLKKDVQHSKSQATNVRQVICCLCNGELRKAIATSHQCCDGCYTNKCNKQTKAAGTSAWGHWACSLDAPLGTFSVTALGPPAERGDQGYSCLCKSTAQHAGPNAPDQAGKLWHFLGGDNRVLPCPCYSSAILDVWVGCGVFFGGVSFFLPSKYSASLLRESLPSKVLEEIIPILIYPFIMVVSNII